MNPYGATLLRLILGVIFLMHGYLAYFVFTPAGGIRYFGSQGIPAPEVAFWYVTVAHLVGGLMLILGFWTRWGALANAVAMVGAILFVHLTQGFFLKGIIVDASKGMAVAGGYEYVLLLLVADNAQVLLGGGALALKKDDPVLSSMVHAPARRMP